MTGSDVQHEPAKRARRIALGGALLGLIVGRTVAPASTQTCEPALAKLYPDLGRLSLSDQGCQYTSLAFGRRCELMGVRPSMGSVGDAYDNAMCESFFATLECELLDRTRFQTQAEARLAVFEYIEGWYNPHRRHSALDYRSPVNYERSDPVLN